MKLILRTIVIDRHIYFRNKRKCNLLTVTMFLMIYYLYLKYIFGSNFVFTKWDWKDDISCYLDKNDELPSITDLKPPPRSIFFHDASCNINKWVARGACAVESAARAHVNWNVYVMFNNPLKKEQLESNIVSVILRELQKFPNVKFARVNTEDYSMNTPVEGFALSGGLNNTDCPIKLTEGLVKYITLYKWGGLFMERDIIVTKSLSSLSRNWVAKQDEKSVGSGLLALSKDAVGKNISETALRDLLKNYKSFDCTSGENVMDEIVRRECSTPDPVSKSAATCNGLEIYGPQFFNPVDAEHATDYLKSGEIPGYETAYTYYLWSRFIPCRAPRERNSRLNELKKKHCPSIHAAMATYG